MRKQLTKIALSASLVLAMAFTLSCSDDGDDPPPPIAVTPGGDASSSSSSLYSSSDGSSSSIGGDSSSSLGGPKCGGVSYDPETQFCDTRDNALYKFVQITIGSYNKIWMAENLKFNATGSKCYGEDGQVWDNEANDYITLSPSEVQANCVKYGRLYDWSTATSSDPRVCPSGWHLPSDDEWTALTDAIGSDPGTNLKAESGWYDGDEYYIAGADTYGFSALPGGGGDSDGYFLHVGYNGYWWSSTEYGGSYAWGRYMNYNIADVGRSDYDKSLLFSVRCSKDCKKGSRETGFPHLKNNL